MVIRNYSLGFSVIEVLLSVSIFALLASAFVGAYIYSREGVHESGMRGRAVFLAEEGLEAVRNMRDADFTSVSSGIYGLATTSQQWTLSGSSSVIDNVFTRSLAIYDSGLHRKLVTSSVSWSPRAGEFVTTTLVSLFTNWRALTNFQFVGDWTDPNSLVSSLNISGNQDGLKVRVRGSLAYVITNNGTADFNVISVANSSSPALVGSLSLNSTPQDLFVSGNYAYVASTDNSQELQIINIATSTAPVLIGSYNDAGNDDARGVYVSGTMVYMAFAGGNDFVVVSAANPAAPSLSGALTLSGTAYDVYVSGSIAYVASDSDTTELQVVNVSNPALPSLLGSLDLAGADNAIAINGFASSVLLGRVGTNNLAIVNVSTSSSPSVISTFNAQQQINDISLGNSNTYAFLGTSLTSNDVQVVNISNPLFPTLVGGYNASDLIFGVDYVSSSDLLYAVSAANSAELMIITP